MSSTLHFKKTPKPTDDCEFTVKHPIKGIFARRYYDHDGSLGGGTKTLNIIDLGFIEGLIVGGNFDPRDLDTLNQIAELLRNDETVDMWFSV